MASRPAELGLVVAVGASLLHLHPLAAPFTLAAVAAKLVLERALRWPFAPAALALAFGQLPYGWLASWPLLALAAPLVWVFVQPLGPPDFTGPCVSRDVLLFWCPRCEQRRACTQLEPLLTPF